MKCCPNCFTDDLARELAAANGVGAAGICDVCESCSSELYELLPESELAYQFEKMLDVFAPVANVAAGVEFESAGKLYEVFNATWDVFRGMNEVKFAGFLRALFPEDARIESMIAGDVALAPERGARSVHEFAFFGAKTWDDFSEVIKHECRYCAEVEHEDILFGRLRALETIVERDSATWYRARIWNGKPFEPVEDELCEPGCDKAGEGRMSPRGVRCLYIASSPVTAMAEIRAAVHDEVAVATLRPKSDMRILDLSRIDCISPFIADVDCANLAANLDNLRRIKEDLARPMRATDDPVEYVPTQYIADCAKHLGFDGIGYDSVMQTGESERGYNIACFHGAKEWFDFEGIRKYRIAEIDYSIAEA